MKVRYCAQTNNFNCGPIALINALKWAGYKATLKTHYKYLARICKTDDPDGHDYSGTWAKDFERGLDECSANSGLEYEALPSPRIDQIERHLRSGGSAVLLHINDHYVPHYTLLVGITNRGKTWIAANAFEGSALSYVSESIIRKWMNTDYCEGYGYPIAWLLHKEKRKRKTHDSSVQ